MSDPQGSAPLPNDAPEAEPQSPQLELETGPLLPRWLSVPLYTFTICWIIVASAWIAWSMVVQHRVVVTLGHIAGPWPGEAPAFDSAELKLGLDTMAGRPREALLYVIQELLQDAISDDNMARAISLRKAVAWGEDSARRDALNEILTSMKGAKGELDPDYALPPDERETIEKLVAAREAARFDSYEQQRVTDVLRWVLTEDRRPAVGPERRRVKSLLAMYLKKLFFSTEARTLAALGEEWAGGEPVRAAVAGKFTDMLAGTRTALTDEEAALCIALADEYEAIYRLGRVRLAKVARMLVVDEIAAEANRGTPEERIDHPEVWDLVQLTRHEYPDVSAQFSDILYALRDRKYVIRFAADAVAADAVNPVMAVATARLTAAEHRRVLYEDLRRRRTRSLEALGRIAVDYYAGEFEVRDLDGDKAAQDAYMELYVIETIKSILEDKMQTPQGGTIGERGGEILREIEAARAR